MAATATAKPRGDTSGVASASLRVPYLLSGIIVVLMATASAGGLLVEDLYRNNLWATSQFRGSDLVRLALVVPVFIAALSLAARGSARGQLIWLGMLWLTLYDYAFYLFGAAFNELFLIYVALFSVSAIALIFALPRIDVDAVARRFRAGTPVRWISSYLLLIATFLGGLWVLQSLAFVFTGQPPQSLVDSGHVTEIVFALDLALLVPGMIIGAAWLWRRRPWGYVVAGMMMVKATLYPIALIGMSVFAVSAGVPDAGSMTPFWVFFAAASLLVSGLLFGNLRAPGPQARDS